MIDFTQFLLGIVITSLTVMLLVIGFQVYKILKELKVTMTKMNKILDDTGMMTESVAKPMAAVSGFLLGLKGTSVVIPVVKFLHKLRASKEED